MALLSHIEELYVRFADFIFGCLPQPRPSDQALKACKIISHRGEHDGMRIKENTLPAFEKALGCGVWGIEFDIRWTSDLVPVVVHDADLVRVFGKDDQIAHLSLNQLQRVESQVPALSTVIERFGGKVHLMIEIKDNDWPDPQRQSKTLLEALSYLSPVNDYHLMALKPEILKRFNAFPAESLLAIANHRPVKDSRSVFRNHWGGLCAHYTLARRSLIDKLHMQHHTIGTAYPKSRNVLFREINRGADFIFSNDACELMRILKKETEPVVG